MTVRRIGACLASLAFAGAATAIEVKAPAPAYGVDSPELALPGRLQVGFRSLHFTEHDWPDLGKTDPQTGVVPHVDEPIDVDVWYPATHAARAKTVVYFNTLTSEPPRPPLELATAGVAVRDAKAAGGPYPLVVASVGYGGDSASWAWLGENLASKGYVLAAVRRPEPYTPSGFAAAALHRVLDTPYVVAQLQEVLGAEHLIDPARIGLIGHSTGGVGVLAGSGAALDPAGAAVRFVPPLAAYARGGSARDRLKIAGLRATVAMAPYDNAQLSVWGKDGLADVSTPLLLIHGDRDRTVDYHTGGLNVFRKATGAHRYLLTIHDAGHALNGGPVPATADQNLWDRDWFQDPVWRKERLNGVCAHFITAFFDRYLKDDESRAPYLDVKVEEGSDGLWDAAPDVAYGAYSPGTGDITLWKGFPRKYATGLKLERAEPEK